jgi:hypothetical protein
MSLQKLLQSRRLHRHQTSRSELDELRAVVARDLADAAIPQLSADRRFAVTYNAVQQLAKMVLTCEAHHATTLEAVALIFGPAQQKLMDYFDTCRQKRNQVNYDHAGLTSDAEANELIERANEFRAWVAEWIKQNHPQFA